MEIIEKPPIAKEYLELRRAAGLSEKSMEAAELGLSNSLYAIHIRENDLLVAMGRVVGDGGAFFQIVDIAVSPDQQGKGLGRLVMERIEDYLSRACLEGSFVSMIADKPGFYEKLGYRYTTPSMGMYKTWEDF